MSATSTANGNGNSLVWLLLALTLALTLTLAAAEQDDKRAWNGVRVWGKRAWDSKVRVWGKRRAEADLDPEADATPDADVLRSVAARLFATYDENKDNALTSSEFRHLITNELATATGPGAAPEDHE